MGSGFDLDEAIERAKSEGDSDETNNKSVETSSGTTRHVNDEPAVVCPADGCDFTAANRAIGPHIRMSADDAHGPKYDVPDHLDIDTAESAGTEKVVMEYPNEQNVGDEQRYCPYCRSAFTGRDIIIHLGSKAGRDNHPESPTEEFETQDFARVETDADGNITAVVEEGKGNPSALIE